MSSAPSGDSEGDEEETTQDEISSHTSEEDGGVVKVEKELENAEQPVGGNEVVEHEVTENFSSDPLLGLCQCPLCQLDCGSREQLIAHVYQVWHGELCALQHERQFSLCFQLPKGPWLVALKTPLQSSERFRE